MPIKGCYTKGEVKARGWNDAMIAQFLGAPDGHHNFGRGIVASLFSPLRVAEVETQAEWQAMAHSFKARSEKAKQATVTHKRRLIETIERQPLRLPVFTPEKLLSAAIESRNNLAWDRWERRQWEELNLVTVEDIPLWPEPHAARDRWCVNYLRHEATGYNRLRRGVLPGHPGQAEALAAWLDYQV